jgi:hypothetical protein
LVPAFLTSALFALGGVFVALGVAVFYYFSKDVRAITKERIVLLVRKETTKRLMEKLDRVDDAVARDFGEELLEIGEPRRLFRSLLLFIPATGILFLGSAFLGLLSAIADSEVAAIAEVGAYALLIVGIFFATLCAINTARLGRKLS